MQLRFEFTALVELLGNQVSDHCTPYAVLRSLHYVMSEDPPEDPQNEVWMYICPLILHISVLPTSIVNTRDPKHTIHHDMGIL